MHAPASFLLDKFYKNTNWTSSKYSTVPAPMDKKGKAAHSSLCLFIFIPPSGPQAGYFLF